MGNNTNVLQFNAALDAGLEPRNYTYKKEEVPLGNYDARLDFMIWSKNGNAINCFFTVFPSGQLISLSVYKNAEDDFLLGNLAVGRLSFGTVFYLNVEQNFKGYPRLVSMEPQDISPT
ncbi:hypothetical protein [Pedobacter sp. MC2016-24]|uniref:hypothetical protein n=1 Tax=Pedobacter sp. MC2016-24 TaxID=2780090 RepID=UPI00187E65ED|nr:hypothetical protein [Pedobacter sp. MC2016-24]MBE9599931.1 hypothetical protein [Pedobacter sp. MC2016-24]